MNKLGQGRSAIEPKINEADCIKLFEFCGLSENPPTRKTQMLVTAKIFTNRGWYNAFLKIIELITMQEDLKEDLK